MWSDSGSNGTLTASFLNYGATLLSFTAPDRNGVVEVGVAVERDGVGTDVQSEDAR